IATLLGLWQDKQRASASVKQIAQTHIDDLQQRIAAMQAMQRTLAQLVSCCAGDARPDCPILDDLAAEDESDAPAATARRKLSKK
ncbi:MAG: MerR family DNA-binding protein, partial [Giesbergeria sp.]|nr:MerR family DNA-binding protein [Giesbergeria sp.]MBP9894787.1 MerR family DNA-binding protein [Giesbergeria sp.]